MNVLVYDGDGTSVSAVLRALEMAHRAFTPFYSVRRANAALLAREPWPSDTRVLIIPGGRDAPYCDDLNGPVNARIRRFVRDGGVYVGLCAGGYYGSSKCVFEQDDAQHRIVGLRELAFYPGSAVGAAFDGFVYNSESGARCIDLELAEAVGGATSVTCYWNGGGVFEGAQDLARDDPNVQVLAYYGDTLPVREYLRPHSGGRAAAVVRCRIGRGYALLTGPHPEYIGANMRQTALDYGEQDYFELQSRITRDDQLRVNVMRTWFAGMGLRTSAMDSETSASPSALRMASIIPGLTTKVMERLINVASHDAKTNQLVMNGGTTAFLLGNQQTKDATETARARLDDLCIGGGERNEDDVLFVPIEAVDIDQAVEGFNFAVYKETLSQQADEGHELGNLIFHANVVTSTQDLLDRNGNFSRLLPSGTTIVGRQQVAGRGRSNNVWISPPGLLAFSMMVRQDSKAFSEAEGHSVTFLQYIESLVVVDAIRSYAPGYETLDIRIKWPNDVYASVAVDDGVERQGTTFAYDGRRYFKMAGVLLTCQMTEQSVMITSGIGINCLNKAPAASIQSLVDDANATRAASGKPLLPPIELERLLARILARLDRAYRRFLVAGFSPFQEDYERLWLHSGQRVVLQRMDFAEAVIEGVDPANGLLLARQVSSDPRTNGRLHKLQSDGNSFDMMKGLIRTK